MNRTVETSPILSGSQVRLASHPIVVSDKHRDGKPSITLHREGDIIKEIHVRCGCGELMVLDCQYQIA